MIHYQTKLILQSVSKLIQLTPAEAGSFLSLLDSRTLKTRQFILTEGNICKHSFFVTKGCLKGFSVDNNGFEHILNFAPPGWWIGAMYSLFSGKPGVVNIQAMEGTEVLLLSKEDQEKLYTDIPKFERFFRIITQNSLVSYQQRVLDNLSLPAEDRYHILTALHFINAKCKKVSIQKTHSVSHLTGSFSLFKKYRLAFSISFN